MSYNKKGLPLAYTQHLVTRRSEKYQECQENECLDEKCLVKEKYFLFNLLNILREEIASCQALDSGLEVDYDENQSVEVERLFKFCQNCSSCNNEDTQEMLKKLHFGLAAALEQLKKLKYFYETVCRTSRTTISESQKKEKMLNDYHVLIAQLTSENLKLREERLFSKTDIEETKKANSEIIARLEDQICCLTSQLSEGLRAKTASRRDCFPGRGSRAASINNPTSPSTSDSAISTELINSWSLSTQKQQQTSHCHRNRSPSSHTDSDWSSDTQDEGSYRGMRISKYPMSEKILDNKLPKKLQSRRIRKHPRFP